MVEQDTAGSVHSVALTVVNCDPVGVDLGGSIWTARIERCFFALRYGLHQPVHLRAGGLVKTGFGGHLPHRVQQPDRSDGGCIAGELRDIEANPNVALSGQVVDLAGLSLSQYLGKRAGVAEIPIMQKEFRPLIVKILVDRINSLCVEAGGAPDDSVGLIPLGQQKFSQIGSILTGDAGD